MPDEVEEVEPGADPEHSVALLAVALVVGLYAMAPGFYLDGLHVKAGAEVVDHVVPGLAMLVLVVAAIRWGRGIPALMLFVGVGIVLCGFWMTDVHIALVRQALQGLAPVGATVYHFSTAIAVDVVGVSWLWRYRHAGSSHT